MDILAHNMSNDYVFMTVEYAGSGNPEGVKCKTHETEFTDHGNGEYTILIGLPKTKEQMNKEQRKQEALYKIKELEKLINDIDNEGPDIPSWEECTKDGFYIECESGNIYSASDHEDGNETHYATREQAKSALAFAQLTQIHREIIKRNCLGWEADFDDPNQNKWCVENYSNMIGVEIYRSRKMPLTLPTKELAQAFLEKHKDLWQTYYKGL